MTQTLMISLATVALAVLMAVQVAVPASAGSTGMSTGDCVGGGYTYRYTSSAVGGTFHTQGASCYKTVNFSWLAPDGTGWVHNSQKNGYGSSVSDSVGLATDAQSTHSMSVFQTVWAFTNSWT